MSGYYIGPRYRRSSRLERREHLTSLPLSLPLVSSFNVVESELGPRNRRRLRVRGRTTNLDLDVEDYSSNIIEIGPRRGSRRR